MAVHTVDENGQVVTTPNVLDDFDYFRDNVLVRTFKEFLTTNPYYFDQNAPIIFDDYNFQGPYNLHVDSNGYIYIILNYYVQGSGVYTAGYLTNETGSWVLHQIQTGVGYNACIYYTHIKKDSSGYLHCCFNNSNNSMKYATNASGSWVVTNLASVGFISLTGPQTGGLFQDSSGYWHVIWASQLNVSPFERRIYHATNASGSWLVEQVYYREAGAWTHVQAVMHSNNTMSLIYHNNVNTVLINGIWGSWGIESTIFSGSLSAPTSHTIMDGSGYIHILNRENGHLGYISDLTNAPSGTWVQNNLFQIDTVSFNVSPGPPRGQFDSSGDLHIGFGLTGVSDNARNVAYATDQSGSWEYGLISFDDWRTYPFAVEENGNVAVIFSDVTEFTDRKLRFRGI